MTTSIKPLQLGHLHFPNNIIQGPLAGISCAPFRRLTTRYSQPAFSCTEMISCKTLLYQSNTHHRFTHIDPEEGPVCFQLSGTDPKELAEAVKVVTDKGATLIDLNCGCPVNKIRRRGAGSSLLTNPSLLYQLITAMKQNTHVPVSIKIRVEGPHPDKFNRDIVKVIQDTGLDFLVVHGRHWTEHYETPCRHDEIQFFVNELKIPVIGNGDVACVNSLKKMLSTGCDAVMIGRAGVGQPWLIQRLMAEMNQETWEAPAASEIGAVFIEHVEHLISLLGNEKFAILQARKFAKYYARGLPQRIVFSERINECKTVEELKSIVQNSMQF